MVWLILGVVLFLVALGMLIVLESDRKTLAIIPLIVAGVFCVVSCIKVVPTGHTGVMTTFGKIEDVVLDSGVSFNAPWRRVITMDNRTQIKSLDLMCFSSDIQEVSVKYTINYKINKANAQDIYRTVGKDYFTVIIEPKVLESVKGVIAKYNAENLISTRANLSNEIEAILIRDLMDYNIEVVSTSIEDIDFSDTFTNAVEAKQVAEQNKLKAQIEQEQQVKQANADAEVQKTKAQAAADSAIISAKADAEIAKISADSAEYQGQKDAAIMSNIGRQLQDYPQLLTYYRVTNWNGAMPNTMLSDSANLLLGTE